MIRVYPNIFCKVLLGIKSSNMRINSKAKGGRFERTMCKWFQKWTGYEFNRVPASGGLRWKKADNITSDIICTDPVHANKFRFSIECKSYNDLRFDHILLQKKTCRILKFWTQVNDDSKRSHKLPMLIMKYNGMPKGEAFVVVNKETYNNCLKPNLEAKKPITYIYNIEGHPDMYLIMLSDLMKASYKDIHKQALKLK